MGKTVTSSSVGWYSTPEMAIDGEINNGILDNFNQVCVHTNDQKNSWIQLDLGDLYYVDHLILYGRNGHVEQSSGWTIYVSETNETILDDTICAVDFNASGGQAFELICQMTGQYVTIRSDRWMVLCELEVYDNFYSTGKLYLNVLPNPL